MSKRRRKVELKKKQKQTEDSNEFHKFRMKHFLFLLTLILTAIPFGAGKYIEFNSPGAFDSGAYVYSAEHVLRGAKMGVDEKPSAQAGTLLMNMLGVWVFGFDDFGPKVVQMLLQIAALVVMFIALRKIFNPFAASVSVIIAATYLSAPLIAKYGNVKEQYMICFMIIGMSLLALRVNGGKWWLAILAGGAIAWGPLFKQTGVSVIGAAGVYLILAVIFRSRTIKQTVTDILLLFSGAVIFLLPVYIWLIVFHNSYKLPYKFVWDMLPFANSDKPVGGSYISKGRQLSDFSTQAKRVLSYYWLLRLPIAIALTSIFVWVYRSIKFIARKPADAGRCSFDKFVPLFSIWWILDMAFVWISPRSYEQYYLPLNASAAMLGGYAFAVYYNNFKSAGVKSKWLATGFAGFVIMVWMGWHIVFGINVSPHSGKEYDFPRRGYIQRLREIQQRDRMNLAAPWEKTAKFIRENSSEDDEIFVWGWYPGIYVYAQRLSPAPKAFEGNMHVDSPEKVNQIAKKLVEVFEDNPPLYIVDTHKVHFPWDRPPLELWPTTPKGIVPNDASIVQNYEQKYYELLKQQVGSEEASRFEAMKPLRDFVMHNYVPVQSFGQQVVFRLRNDV